MSITLLQKDSFEFDPKVKRNTFNISGKIGIDCILETLKRKIENSDKIENHIWFIKGRTGSGKSSYMPTRIFEYMDKTFKNIVVDVVEPRVILAKSISSNNCNIPGAYVKMGYNTGYATGKGKTNIKNKSKLLYMTPEIFRNKLISNSTGNICIIDECHDMDLSLILSMYLIKEYLKDQTIKTKDKPIFIFTSATIDLEMMVNYYFGPDGILLKDSTKDIYEDGLMISYIAGSRNFPVKEEYYESKQIDVMNDNKEKFVKEIVTNIVDRSIKSKSVYNGMKCRDILIFAAGAGFFKMFNQDVCEKYSKYPIYSGSLTTDDTEQVLEFRKKNLNKTRVLILPYSSNCKGFASSIIIDEYDLDEESQKNEIKIYLSTNVMETGKTISTLYQVFDTGFCFKNLPIPLTYRPGSSNIIKMPIEVGSSIQRCGRIGRKSPGISTRVFTEQSYKNMITRFPVDLFIPSLGYSLYELYNKIISPNKLFNAYDLNKFVVKYSFDTMLRSTNDLISVGLISSFGKNLVMKEDINTINNNKWITEALCNYYIDYSEDIMKSLFTARYKRRDLGLLIQPTEKLRLINPEDIPEEEMSEELIGSILDAHTEYIRMLYKRGIINKEHYIVNSLDHKVLDKGYAKTDRIVIY